MSLADVEVIDLAAFLDNETSEAAVATAAAVADSFKRFGVVIVRDPRVSTADSNRFVDLMEDYFAQSDDDKKPDIFPNLSYQVGATPAFTEEPRCVADERCHTAMATLAPEHRPLEPKGPDAKWRFFWRVGERPTATDFPELNAPQVVPAAFKDVWASTMDGWGDKMLDAVTTVARMTGVGLGLEADRFSSLMKHGAHLLAPTGSDLVANGKDTILAGFHTDLNFMTIHGKSRYPGLHVWLRDQTKCRVKVPEGCLLVQAAQQLEYLTGGAIVAGFHEVIVSDATVAAVEQRKTDAPERPLWRVSSTLFSHLASDRDLAVMPEFVGTCEDLSKYPPTKVGAQVEKELQAISLSKGR